MAAISLRMAVPRSALRILGDATSLKSYASSATVLREFCVHCGSTLFWSRSQGEFADWVSIEDFSSRHADLHKLARNRLLVRRYMGLDTEPDFSRKLEAICR